MKEYRIVESDLFYSEELIHAESDEEAINESRKMYAESNPEKVHVFRLEENYIIEID